MLNKTLSILSLLLLQAASTMLLVRPAGAALVWGTVVDTVGAPVVDAIVEFASMADTTQVFSAPTGADGFLPHPFGAALYGRRRRGNFPPPRSLSALAELS